jgi:serine/threonine-protein kinase
MEFLQGPTLGKELEKGPMDPVRACQIGVQIARGLHAVHEQGIVHRDLKPQNIFLLTQAGQTDCVKIVDFGIAFAGSEQNRQPPRHVRRSLPPRSGRALNDDSALAKTLQLPPDVQPGEPAAGQSSDRYTIPGTIMGTPQYMPPEQVRGDDVDARSDQYALGCILYEMLTGVVPFDDEKVTQVLQHHLTADPPPMRERNRALAIPLSLETLVLRMLQKTPDDRLASMREVELRLQEELELLLVQRGEKLTVSQSSAASLRRQTSGSIPSIP